MPTPGQPTLYKPEYCELAHNYCLLGATNEVLGNFFHVAPRTVDNWIATHPDFADAVYGGRAVAEIRAKKIGTDRLLLRFEKALLPVTVILEPCNGTQKFVLLRAEPTGRERCGKNMRHAGE
jgi:hypothetical protein